MGTDKEKHLGTEITRAFESAGLAEDFNYSSIKSSVETLEDPVNPTPRARFAAREQILGYVESVMEENRDTPKYIRCASLRTRIEGILMGAK